MGRYSAPAYHGCVHLYFRSGCGTCGFRLCSDLPVLYVRQYFMAVFCRMPVQNGKDLCRQSSNHGKGLFPQNGNAVFHLYQPAGGVSDTGWHVCDICPDLSVCAEISHSDHQIYLPCAAFCLADDDAGNGMRNYYLCPDNQISGFTDAD